MCPPVHRAQFVQRTKNLVRQWHHNVFHGCGQLFNVDLLWRLGGIRANGKTAENTRGLKISYKRHHWYFRLLISDSYSGFNGANLNRNFRSTTNASTDLIHPFKSQIRKRFEPSVSKAQIAMN
jgi:hypothetical protein